jgi:tetratricopeptide (TPR) repeat protein
MASPVVIVGQLASMTRAEAGRVIALTGGELAERVTHATKLVIVGARGPQLQRNGRLPPQLVRARRLAAEGHSVVTLPEDQWLESVGLPADAAGVHRRFTAGQMAKSLAIPRAKLDRWLAAGLIQPVEVNAGIPLFEFQQVAAVRTLAELIQAGISLAKVRRAAAHLGRWGAAAGQPLLELTFDDDIRRLVVRTAAGRLAEPTGQLLFDFDPSGSAAVLAFGATETEEDLFRRAVQEEEDRPLEAAELYLQLIAQRGPHASLLFNLGNALYAADDCEGALAAYRRAAELDPRHAGAWNNLANVLAELDRPEEAIGAYRQALAVDPQLADARFNLAQTLVEIGRAAEAVLHWRAYLAVDTESAWAEYAEERLQLANAEEGI